MVALPSWREVGATGAARAGEDGAVPDDGLGHPELAFLICTFWLSFNATRGAHAEKGSEDLGQGIFQVMMLIAPFLRDAERLHLNTLANNYRK